MRALLILLCALAAFTSKASAHNFEATFNTPGFNGDRTTTIFDKMIKMIDDAADGSSIHISLYDFDQTPIALALLKANARGVKIFASFDGDLKSQLQEENTPINLLMNGSSHYRLPKLSCTSKDCIRFCKAWIFGKSCRGILNNHNKFVIFSQLKDGRRNVVTVSSSNWTAGQTDNQNDLLIIANDSKLYSEALNYWQATMGKKVSVPFILKGATAALYTFPNTKFDPVLEALNQTTCDLPGSKIRVMQSRFTDARTAVAKRLVQLSKEGCDVRVLTRNEPNMGSPGKKVVAILGSLNTILKYKLPDGGGLSSIHSKIVLIDARVNGSQARAAVVLAGSHNLNFNSLKRNDEILARVVDRSLLDTYMNYWQTTVDSATASGMILQ